MFFKNKSKEELIYEKGVQRINKKKIRYLFVRRVSLVAAGLFRLLYYNEKAFGVVGNVSNWSLGRTAWKKEGPTTLLKEHQCVCERELRQMLVFLPFAVSP